MRTARRARPLGFGRYAPYAQGAHDRRDSLRIPGIVAGAPIGTGRQECRGDISALEKRGHFCFALTPPLAVNLAEHALLADDADERPVVVFSLEQPVEQLILRLLSSLGAIEYGHLRSGTLQDGEWARLDSAIRQLSGRALYIDDAPAAGSG